MGRTLWIEAHGYATALLQGGEEPWSAPGEIGRLCAEAAELLDADRLLLPLAPLLDRFAPPGGDAPEDRAERLDDAVADGALLAALTDALASLDGAAMLDRIVPVLPGPAAAIGGKDDEDALDTAAMALGDILRTLGEYRLAAVAIAEADAAGLAAANPLFRIADHLGCAMAVLGQADHPHAEFCFPEPRDAISPVGKGDCQTIGARALVRADIARAEAAQLQIAIGADMGPEIVLECLAALRAGE
ncbi:hypothetical protein HFP57_16455 [Parasphingopyxis algicola]|uniref:hypothetical protein n=1 Tax=Parasphingopyxis algicola TaxID=2026624 RepID=UPI00159FC7FD|nr:hypothetical protein [Parasphingopyxis algicola]QLC26466.1 hypothetical protein HFP57_16455 [Parasphingopyxis algicola]